MMNVVRAKLGTMFYKRYVVQDNSRTTSGWPFIDHF